MFSEVQKKALAQLERYFTETPAEVIQAEIDAISRINFPGPTIDEYFMNFHKSFELDEIQSYKNINFYHKYKLTNTHYQKNTRLKTKALALANHHANSQKSYNRLIIST
jgi:hypothetical protein